MTGARTNPHAASSVAKTATPNAGKYLAQLCKHFQHKLPAEWAEKAGSIEFPIGRRRLTAGEGELEIALAGIVRAIFRTVFGCGSFRPWATRSDISTARQRSFVWS